MIRSFNAREKHPKDKMVLDWYDSIYKSERSRKIVDILYAHITDSQHTIPYEVGESLPAKKEKKIESIKMTMVDLTGGEEIDLDSKLDLLGGGC
jgi:hypothetical protein